MSKEKLLQNDNPDAALYIGTTKKSYLADTSGSSKEKLWSRNSNRINGIEVRLYYPVTPKQEADAKEFFEFMKKNNLPLREAVIQFFDPLKTE